MSWRFLREDVSGCYPIRNGWLKSECLFFFLNWRIYINPSSYHDASTNSNENDQVANITHYLKLPDDLDCYLSRAHFNLNRPISTYIPKLILTVSPHLKKDGLMVLTFKVDASDIEEEDENSAVLDFFDQF